ncbi:MAG: methyltransferase domain-containing protein [Pseudomonadota bacterium]
MYTDNDTLDFYARHSTRFAERYESLDPETIHAPWKDLLPPPCRVLDAGAGTGRDAAWLAALGYRVAAMEPVAAFRDYGSTHHTHPNIRWIDDRLPSCRSVRRLGLRFGLILAGGVWMHLAAADQSVAMTYLAGLLGRGGRLVITLRHGPSPDGRRMRPVTGRDVGKQAAAAGLALIRDAGSPDAFSRADISWQALVYEKPRQ